jgi:hypothetical protein
MGQSLCPGLKRKYYRLPQKKNIELQCRHFPPDTSLRALTVRGHPARDDPGCWPARPLQKESADPPPHRPLLAGRRRPAGASSWNRGPGSRPPETKRRSVHCDSADSFSGPIVSIVVIYRSMLSSAFHQEKPALVCTGGFN